MSTPKQPSDAAMRAAKKIQMVAPFFKGTETMNAHRERLAAEYAAIIDAETGAKWLPIASAPKDGTRILLGRTGWAEPMCAGWWNTHYDEWWSVGCASAFLEVTQWMPLPPAPEVGT
jgi:hypothetical protein